MPNNETIINNLNETCKNLITEILKLDDLNNNSKILDICAYYDKDIAILLKKHNTFKKANQIYPSGYELLLNLTDIMPSYTQSITELSKSLYTAYLRKHNENEVNDIIQDFMKYIGDIKRKYVLSNYSKNGAKVLKEKLSIFIIPEMIEPFMIFDYYYQKEKASSKRETTLLDNELNKLMNEKYKKYFEKIFKEKDMNNMDDLNLTFNNVKFSYKNGNYYMNLKDSNNLTVLDSSKEKMTISLPKTLRIITINGKKPSFQEILNSVRDMYYNYNIIDLVLSDNQEKTYTYQFETSSLLGERSIYSKENTDIFTPGSKSTENLDKYGKDLTKETYTKNPSVGREEELRRIYQILLYPEKDKSIIVTGEAGVGKTALVRGLAYNIKNGLVPNALKDLKIYSLFVSSLVAGTKYVGTLEEKLEGILKEASSDKNIILFIDEIHQAINAGVSDKDTNSVSEILKPYIDNGDVRIIGATTRDEYEEHICSDQAFKTRFKKVDIDEPNNYVLYGILEDLILKYNEIASAKISEENISKVITWLIGATDKKYRKYNDQSNNPRLIIDIVKEAYAIAALNDSDEVTIQYIIDAYNAEDRIYPSSKELEIQKLKQLIPHKLNQPQIIKFVPKK